MGEAVDTVVLTVDQQLYAIMQQLLARNANFALPSATPAAQHLLLLPGFAHLLWNAITVVRDKWFAA